MSLPPVTNLTSPTAASAAVGESRAAATQRPAEPREPEAVVTAPAEPPAKAIEAVRTAARAYERMLAADRELRFSATDSGLRIEVYDGTGRLVQRIPPNEALALASREVTTWLA